MASVSARPVSQRKYHAFLSHAHADRAIVDALHGWLTEIAAVPVWYDGTHLAPSAPIVTALAEGIAESRSVIIVLSEASVRSGWVQEEYGAAMAQRTWQRDFRIVPIRIDDAEVPGFLQTTKWIDLTSGTLGLAEASDLLTGLYGSDGGHAPADSRDVYVSRTWRESEGSVADLVCRELAALGFRLIGDSKDQEGFDGVDRVPAIVASCGAFAAVLPDRGGGETSGYMMKEIEHARALGLPRLIVAEPGVELPPDLADEAISVSSQPDEVALAALRRGTQRVDDEWDRPSQPHRVFFSTALEAETPHRNECVKQALERVTAMPCVIGDDIRQGQIQRVIVDAIRDAFLVVADISEDNLNTCIEAGVALGAGRRLHLVAAGPRRRPAFMFRDQQVWYYENDVELLGLAHRIGYPYRRRVLNLELAP